MRFEKTKRAFTMVEVLIALAITAMLLVAVAAAFNASVKNYQENEKMFNTLNKARQALLRMTAQLRNAAWVEPDTSTVDCKLRTPTNADPNITYSFSSSDQKLYRITDDNLSDSDYVLCDNVTAMSFTKDIENGIVKSVVISMTIAVGDSRQTVSSAAVIRKNLK